MCSGSLDSNWHDFFAALTVKHFSQKSKLDNKLVRVAQTELGLLFSYYYFPTKNYNVTRLIKILSHFTWAFIS